VYWARHRTEASQNWPWRLFFSSIGFFVTSGILLITIYAKFTEGGWVTLLITGAVIALCLLTKHHYQGVNRKLHALNIQLSPPLKAAPEVIPSLDRQAPTAIFFINRDRSVSMHTLLWVLRMFPDHFKNFIFIGAGQVDIESFQGKKTLETLQKDVNTNLQYFVNYCHQYGLAAEYYHTFGTDMTDQLVKLAVSVSERYPNSIFFATKLIFEKDNWITRLLHNETAMMLQRRLHLVGKQMVILPMKL
jgi:K+ transporter